MTAEEHITLYNIGLNYSCGEPRGYHLCPQKRNYEFFLYWTAVLDKSISSDELVKFGSRVNGIELKLDCGTGMEQVSLSRTISVCNESPNKNLVRMIWASPYEVTKCVRVIRKLIDRNKVAEYIKFVAIEKTLVFFENVHEWDIPLIDFVDVFDYAALKTHFRSLADRLLEEISSGEQGTDIIKAMTSLLSNWERIYQNKEKVIDQVNEFIKMMILGIEGMDKKLICSNYVFSKLKADLKVKRDSKDYLSFLFLEEEMRERFRKFVYALSIYLEKYTDSNTELLVQHLSKFYASDNKSEEIRIYDDIDWNIENGKEKNSQVLKKQIADGTANIEGELLKFTE